MNLKRTRGIRHVMMNSFNPTPLLMTTDNQLAALRQRIAQDAVRQALIKNQDSKNMNPGAQST